MTDATTRSQRYAFGRTVLDSVDGAAGGAVVDALSDVSPELGHQVVS
ncbi:MAG: hypothetical protein QM658_17590 [Gordonia sp. (in: high G+C Gram-positive bacteria)]